MLVAEVACPEPEQARAGVATLELDTPGAAEAHLAGDEHARSRRADVAQCVREGGGLRAQRQGLDAANA